MGRDATKAAGNPWYQARKKAAEYDDRLCSRESAAEQLGMSVSSLADAELGNTKFMPVDKAVLMADRYNAPWLLNHYCLNECPIGCRHSLSDEVVGIDRVTVKLLKSLKTEKLGDVKDTLLDIAADGKITEDEKPALQEVLAYLDDLAKTVSELKTIGEMALNEDGDAHGSKYTMAWAFAETRERLRMYEETRLSPLDLKDRLIAPFQNDMFAMVWGAFKKLYPDKECEIYWEPQIRDEEDGKPVYGLTDFADDGSVAVFVKPSLEVADAVEVLAHELAHVAVGVEHDHDEVWQEAFDKIFEEYNRIGNQMFPNGEQCVMDDPDEK